MEKYITSGKIIVVLGPNASGKSEFAVKIAKKFNGEIISADSRQVYKGLDIGSGKVEGKWRKISNFKPTYRTGRFLISNQIPNSKSQIPNKSKIKNLGSQTKKYFVYKNIVHHCIDFVNPGRIFSGYDFKKSGEKAIAEIISRGKIPIICGGTGFYIDALLGNVNLAEVSTDFKLRKNLEKKSCEEIFSELQRLNPERAKNIDKNNKRRLIRAIEIEKFENKKNSPNLNICSDLGNKSNRTSKHGGATSKFDILYLGINHLPEILKQRIEKRLAMRLTQGMLKEIRNLHFKKGASWKRLYDLGLEYRFASLFLRQKEKIQKSQKLSLKEKKVNTEKAYADFILKIKTESWHYAKRQMTWFKRNKEINWIDLTPKKLKTTEKLIKEFLTKK